MNDVVKNKGGRPSIYSDEVAEQICDRLAEGESLRNICRTEGMPKMTTVLEWVDEDRESFRGRYARAREAKAETVDAKIQEIADNATPETANLAKVQITAHQWRAAKLAPKRYGDKVQHTGSDGESPIATNLTVTFVKAGEAHRQQKLIEGEWRDNDADDEAS